MKNPLHQMYGDDWYMLTILLCGVVTVVGAILGWWVAMGLGIFGIMIGLILMATS